MMEISSYNLLHCHAQVFIPKSCNCCITSHAVMTDCSTLEIHMLAGVNVINIPPGNQRS